MKKPETAKERNLLKGAMRRLFSRSELRKEALSKSQIEYTDPERPRVKKWSVCPQCNKKTPTYLMEIDHISPIIGTDERLEDLTWDQVVDRIWCNVDNLRALCKQCHIVKTTLENKQRRDLKKGTTKREKAKRP